MEVFQWITPTKQDISCSSVHLFSDIGQKNFTLYDRIGAFYLNLNTQFIISTFSLPSSYRGVKKKLGSGEFKDKKINAELMRRKLYWESKVFIARFLQQFKTHLKVNIIEDLI